MGVSWLRACQAALCPALHVFGGGRGYQWVWPVTVCRTDRFNLLTGLFMKNKLSICLRHAWANNISEDGNGKIE